MKKALLKYWPLLVWIALAGFIFAPAFGKYTVLPSPDSPPGPLNSRLTALNDILAGENAITPHELLAILLPPYTYNDFTYLLDVILAALGFAYFLVGRGHAAPVAAFGGGVYAFMGYSLTLFFAGHRAYFAMNAYVPLLFAFLARAVSTRRLRYYFLAAVDAAWIIKHGIDVGVLFLALAALYWLCLAASEWHTAGEERAAFAKRAGLGVALAAAAFLLCAAPTLRNAFGSLLADRQAAISQQASPAGGAADKDGAQTNGAGGEDEKWIFVTNWSLPPDETLEFVAPAVFGRHSQDADAPYWGRLGRTWKWEKTHQGFFNFRQHVVYLGALPLALALFAVFALATARRRLDPARRLDVAFWSCAFVVALLLAFGRYTPFYRLFYALPYISFLRAPVKFMRLVEFATAALAAAGLAEILAENVSAKCRRAFTFTCAGLAAAFALAALFAKTAPMSFCAPLVAAGAGSGVAARLAGKGAAALLHAVVGFALAAALSRVLARDRLRGAPGRIVAVLSLAIAIDVAIVARPFALVQDMEFAYTDRNPVTQEVRKMPDLPIVTSLVAEKNPQLDELLRKNVSFHGLGVRPNRALNHNAFLATPQGGGLLRMMQLTGSEYAVLPARIAHALPTGALEPVCGLEPSGSPVLFSKTMAPKQDGFLLCKVKDVEPYARLHARWTYAPEEGYFASVAKTMGPRRDILVVSKDIPCPSNSGDDAGKVEVVKIQGFHGALETTIRTEATAERILVLTQNYGPALRAYVDGKESAPFLAGYGLTGVHLPAGRHVVTLRSRSRNLPSAAFSCLFLVAFAAVFARSAASRNRDAP